MIEASYSDKDTIVDILANSFNDNKSVNYIIKQDAQREKRIRVLMAYSFKVCHAFGRVVLSEDKKACALVVFSDQKKTTLRSILWDLQLVVNCIGIAGVTKAMRRGDRIKKLQPKEPLYYLWFIGVQPEVQNKGIGSVLLCELMEDAEAKQRTFCLETSTLNNIPWYLKWGLEIYNELDLGYKLVFLKRK
jgi:ribosomal protein S18 acetylase RimI-like enzyme